VNTALSEDPNDHLTCDPKSCNVAGKARSLDGRHPGTVAIMKYFEYGHLPENLRLISQVCHDNAYEMIRRLPDGPELTTGLRKLLEAKDCFVRAALG
jgi:hypothetical protein